MLMVMVLLLLLLLLLLLAVVVVVVVVVPWGVKGATVETMFIAQLPWSLCAKGTTEQE